MAQNSASENILPTPEPVVSHLFLHPLPHVKSFRQNALSLLFRALEIFHFISISIFGCTLSTSKTGIRLVFHKSSQITPKCSVPRCLCQSTVKYDISMFSSHMHRAQIRFLTSPSTFHALFSFFLFPFHGKKSYGFPQKKRITHIEASFNRYTQGIDKDSERSPE